MSFSSDVKIELCLSGAGQPACCMKAELYGFLLFSAVYERRRIRMNTENLEVAKRLAVLCDAVAGAEASIAARGGRTRGYVLTVEGEEDCRRLYFMMGRSEGEISLRLNRANLEEEGCAGALLRGAFLAGGTVTDPQREYHMEFVTSHLALSRDLTALLSENEIPARSVVRKGSRVVYIKESERIEDLLHIMGATKAAFDIMNVKIYKDIKNKANRITNCETANLEKTIGAAVEQVEAIRRIQANRGMDGLTKELREVAEARLAHPDLPLQKLGAQLCPPISKSGVNHRLIKLMELAKQLDRKEG